MLFMTYLSVWNGCHILYTIIAMSQGNLKKDFPYYTRGEPLRDDTLCPGSFYAEIGCACPTERKF